MIRLSSRARWCNQTDITFFSTTQTQANYEQEHSNCRQRRRRRRRHARDAQWRRAVSGRFLDGPRAKQSHSFRPFVRPSVRRTTTKAKKTCAKNMAHSSTSGQRASADGGAAYLHTAPSTILLLLLLLLLLLTGYCIGESCRRNAAVAAFSAERKRPLTYYIQPSSDRTSSEDFLFFFKHCFL